MKKKISVSWSGGKDSAFALYKIINRGDYEVVHLHTVIDSETKRVGMHGVHETLIEEQAKQIGLPLVKLYLEQSDSHDAYTKLMESFFQECKASGIESIVFGDIFLEDLKVFREKLLTSHGLTGIFPLWQIDSKLIITDFLRLKFKTLICCANGKIFDSSVMGKTIDAKFLNDLPANVDPCGEHGEFHTFVFDGPVFNQGVKFRLGEVVTKHYSFGVSKDNGEIEEESIPFLFQDLRSF